MNSMYFSEEHEAFRSSFKDFLQKEVVPHIENWEKTGEIERFIWTKFGEMGYFGLSYPEEYGGLNLDLFYMVIFLEELQKINWEEVDELPSVMQCDTITDEAVKKQCSNPFPSARFSKPQFGAFLYLKV